MEMKMTETSVQV